MTRARPETHRFYTTLTVVLLGGGAVLQLLSPLVG